MTLDEITQWLQRRPVSIEDYDVVAGDNSPSVKSANAAKILQAVQENKFVYVPPKHFYTDDIVMPDMPACGIFGLDRHLSILENDANGSGATLGHAYAGREFFVGHLSVRAPVNGSSTRDAIKVRNLARARFLDLSLRGSYGLNGETSLSNVDVERILVEDNAIGGINIGSSSGIKLRKIEVYSPSAATGHGIRAANCSDFELENFFIDKPATFGVVVRGQVGGDYRRIKVRNGTILGNIFEGVVLGFGGDDAEWTISQFELSDLLIDFTQYGVSRDFGLGVYAGNGSGAPQSFSVSDGVVHNVRVRGSGDNAFNFIGAVSDIRVSDCKARNPGQYTPSAGFAFVGLPVGPRKCLVSDCYAYSDDGKMVHGFEEQYSGSNGAQDNDFNDCKIKGATGSDYSIGGVGSRVSSLDTLKNFLGLPATTITGAILCASNASGAMAASGASVEPSGVVVAKKFRTESGSFIGVPDDSAVSFTPGGGLPPSVVIVTSQGGAGESGVIWLRASTSPASGVISAGANLAVAIGVLTGTTGTDGKLTISVATDGKIYIENRTGGSRSVSLALFGV